MASGEYKTILAKWNLESAALDGIYVNSEAQK